MHQEIPQYDVVAVIAAVSTRRLLADARRRYDESVELVRRIDEEFERRLIALGALASITEKLFATRDGKQIDDRPCDEFASSDTDWGEQDDLRNVPRKVVQ
jgi:hypothetical protein